MPETTVPGQPASRVLLVTRNLPPLVGGMERLNLHLVLELRRQFEVMVVGPTGCAAHLPAGVVVEEVPHAPLWKFLMRALPRSVRLGRSMRPACVMAGSGLTAPLVWIAARLCGARAVAYVHGLDLVARHRLYRWLWLPFLRRMHLCIANSRHTAGLAASSGIPSNRISIVHPGVEAAHSADSRAAEEFRSRYGLGSRKIVLSVGRMTPRKGLAEFVENSMPGIAGACPDAVLVVIGDEAPDALGAKGLGTARRIEALAAREGLSEHVRLLGPCDDSELTAAYQAADLLVFPLRPLSGDVEGFGMVAIEAASYGIPTVAFRVGGVEDAVSEGRSGWMIPPGDYEALARRVQQALTDDWDEQDRRRCREFAGDFSLERFGVRVRELLNGS